MHRRFTHALWLLPLFGLACNCHKHATATHSSDSAHASANATANVVPPPNPNAGFIPLFDGKTINGWKVGKNADSWKVENGELVVHGPGPAHLFYDGPVHNHDWKNFHLKAMVMTRPHANSGIYFHTKYQEEGWPSQGFEAQVNQTQSDRKKTGGLYAVKDVMDTPPAADNQWFLYEIIVDGKHVTIKIDGKVTTDWTEPTPPTPPPSMSGRFLQHGTIALQGHDPDSETHYKDITIKALPE
jgi:hypothetical protein